MPVVVTRDVNQTGVVLGTLYRKVVPVGTDYNLGNNTNLKQVTYLLRYTYRGKPFNARLVSLRARD